MQISKERLIKEQKITRYRQEIIEKVIWLIEILNSIAEDSFLKSRLVLKGGTALNLFYFDLPRLSVDIDFNYIGSIKREEMLKERPEIKKRIQLLLQSIGLNLIRDSGKYATVKMTWQYVSALNNRGNIDIDISFMYRTPLLPTEKRNSIELAGRNIPGFLLLNLHELAAGKIAALLERAAARDFFDAYNLFQYDDLDIKKLRFCFIIYAAMRNKNFLDIAVKNIMVDSKNLQDKLVPVLKTRFDKGFSNIKDWTKNLIVYVQDNLEKLLVFDEKEKLFIDTIYNFGEIKPELLTSDLELIGKIKKYPGLLQVINSIKKEE